MKLYHGSTVAVKNPSLNPGRPNADFGKGFYTTSSKEQAIRWAHIKKERENAAHAIVSVFEFDEAIWITLIGRFANSLVPMSLGSTLLRTVENQESTITI